MEGFKYKEIADKLNIPIGTVREFLHRKINEIFTRIHFFF